MAWFWLPETVHRAAAGTGMPFRNLAAMMQRPGLRRMLVIDFVYWFAFAIFQTTFALFVARRFGFDAPKTGYFFAAFGVLGVIVQGGFIRPIVHRLGDKPTFMVGLVFSAIGLVAATYAHSVTLLAVALVPLALGIGFGHPDGVESGQPRGRAATSRGACRAPPARWRASAARLVRSGATPRFSGSARRCRICRPPVASRSRCPEPDLHRHR